MIPQESKTIDFGQLYGLTEDQRQQARAKAAAGVVRRIGPRPDRAHFQDTSLSTYPRSVTLTVAIMLVIVFIAAASISTFRLYAAGRDYFMESLPIAWQAKTVGIATAIMAEFLVITAASAATILFTGRARMLAAIPVCIGLAVAFVGNHQVTQAHTLWGWLDTLAPPLAVLSVGVMGERVLLLTLRERWANDRAYAAALAEWRRATSHPEASEHWRPVFMHELKQALIRANTETGTGPGLARRREIVAAMNAHDWRQLVERELRADDWTALPASAPDPAPGMTAPVGQYAPPIAQDDHYPLLVPPVGGNGNGRH